MKKIIYSLVIMIAAGSLFTSCVTNTEPQGIKDLRESKANYLDALAELRKADAELVKAEAAYQAAETAYRNAEVKIREAEAAKAQAQSDADIAKIIADAKTEAVNAEKALAVAKYELEKALRDIAVNSKTLTTEEGKAITAYVNAYQDYINAVDAIRALEEEIYEKKIEEPTAKYAAWVEKAKAAKAAAQTTYDVTKEQQEKAKQDYIDNLPDSGKAIAKAESLLKDNYARLAELQWDSLNIEKNWQVFKTTDVNESISGFSSDLIDWFSQNVAIPAPFIMNYKAKLPDNRQVFNLLQEKWGYLLHYEVDSFTGLLAPMNDIAFEEDEEGFWLLANFYNSAIARHQIFGNYSSETQSLYALFDALNRDKVVDPTLNPFDTTGMAKAVAAAEKEYEAVLDTLNKKVMEYPEVKEAVAAYKKAVADSAKNKDALDKAIDSLKNSWTALCKLYASAGDHSELFDYFFPTYSSNFEGAVTNFAKARKAYFGEAANDLDSIEVLSINEASFEFEPKTVAISNLNKEFTAIKSEGQYYSRFYPGSLYLSKEEAQMVGYNVVLMTLLPVYDGNTWYRNDSHDFVADGFEGVKFYFSTPVVFNKKGEAIIWEAYEYAKIEEKANYYKYEDGDLYTPLDLIAAEEAQFAAKVHYYKNIYCYFWGIPSHDLFESDGWNKIDVCFKNPDRDSLDAKAFSLATFNDPTPIVNFDFDNIEGAWYKDGEFYYKGHKVSKKLSVDAEDDYELSVVSDIIASNLFKAGKNLSLVNAGSTLAAQVLYKQSMLAYFNEMNGTDSVTDALAALEDIAEDIADAYEAALEKQAKNSEPFFKFLEGFVGPKCLDYICSRLDSALTKAAEYIPAYVDNLSLATKGGLTNTYTGKKGRNIAVRIALELAQKVASGEITSKEALVQLFDQFMCGEFDYTFKEDTDPTALFIGNIANLAKEDDVSRVRDEEKYRNAARIRYIEAYIAVQVGNAFSGEVFRTLAAEVLKAFIEAVADEELIKGITTGTNMVEKIIFGTVHPESLKISDIKNFITAIKSDEVKVEVMLPVLKVIAPVIVPYLYSEQTLDGIISQLERKWFTEWAEEWSTYDVTLASIKAEQETLAELNEILEDYYEKGDAMLGISEYIAKCDAKIAKAKADLAAAEQDLKDAEAGPDIYETHNYERYQDKLAKAQEDLKAAEAKLAAAEAAYKQVLANHGLTE